MTRVAIVGAMLLLGLSVATSGADLRYSPKRDPFQKPELEVALEPEPASSEQDTVEVEPARLPQLRAILHSPRTTLVNLDGKMVAIGATYEGYRVAAAGDRDVVLLAGEQTYVVSIDTRKKDDAGRRY